MCVTLYSGNVNFKYNKGDMMGILQDKNGKWSGKRIFGGLGVLAGIFIAVWSAVWNQPGNYVLLWPVFVPSCALLGVSIAEKKEV